MTVVKDLVRELESNHRDKNALVELVNTYLAVDEDPILFSVSLSDKERVVKLEHSNGLRGYSLLGIFRKGGDLVKATEKVVRGYKKEGYDVSYECNLEQEISIIKYEMREHD